MRHLASAAAMAVAVILAAGLSAHAQSVGTPGAASLSLETRTGLLHSGMSATLLARSAGYSAETLAILDETTGSFVAIGPAGSAVLGAVVTAPQAVTAVYAAAALNAMQQVVALGPPITVRWTEQGNGSSQAYTNTEDEAANGVYTLSAGADASSSTVTMTLGSQGMGPAWYNAYAYGHSLSGHNTFPSEPANWYQFGWQPTDQFVETFAALDGVTRIQLAGYASPGPWGAPNYNPAKASAPTFIVGSPPPAFDTASLYQVGSLIRLTGLLPSEQVWWAPVELGETSHWFDQDASAAGRLTVPATAVGALEFAVGTTVWYVDIES